MKVLKGQDILALGFMTFALFVGAGNIIFPPIVGLQAGPHVWMAALGFLVTAVGLPVVTVIALARVGGSNGCPEQPDRQDCRRGARSRLLSGGRPAVRDPAYRDRLV
ncbi:Branched-chain amino acid transport system II carrier protein [Pseudomonas savastanoi]|uniref:Branched-chain amino acid transport system carrier protein n=1 Tax=Pseudomonas savastanoi TaxID=29438 RepID=A0A3M5BUZ6_PSESS|nr:Branched-chain amino acid transport system II carrier protein [Pseudomonas savastanoi]RMT27632.1 Branched-chain amino acid transport system II carrier protein [Pseudomonas savastanoi]